MWAFPEEQVDASKQGSSMMALEREHQDLFKHLEENMAASFASLQKALVDLELQLLIKLKQMQSQQEERLASQKLNGVQVQEFEEAARKIKRSSDAFAAHADNLSHVKLTLARAAALVSPSGTLALLFIEVFFLLLFLFSRECWLSGSCCFFGLEIRTRSIRTRT
jgi:hypothetical protein